jgi:hypothetical protein
MHFYKIYKSQSDKPKMASKGFATLSVGRTKEYVNKYAKRANVKEQLKLRIIHFLF